jgi:CBS-domain-containing membrane protein
MHPAFDLVKRLCEVLYGEALTETSTRFVTLPVALTSGVLLVASFVCGSIGSQLVC